MRSYSASIITGARAPRTEATEAWRRPRPCRPSSWPRSLTQGERDAQRDTQPTDEHLNSNRDVSHELSRLDGASDIRT